MAIVQDIADFVVKLLMVRKLRCNLNLSAPPELSVVSVVVTHLCFESLLVDSYHFCNFRGDIILSILAGVILSLFDDQRRKTLLHPLHDEQI